MVHPTNNLRCHIPRRPTSLLRIILFPLPRNPKIRNPRIPILLEHNILRLQIPMDDITRMDVLQSQHYAANDETYDSGWGTGLLLVEVFVEAHVIT